MVVYRNAEVLYQCKVLYIGSAVPIQTARGVEAMQRPLFERYPGDLSEVEGIDANLAVLPDCIQMTYTSTGQIVQFPLRNLNICAAVRCITALNGATGEKTKQFVPVNVVSSDSKHPAVFSVVVRRSQGRQILECHAFICNSNRDALHLVNATGTANMALKRMYGKKIKSENQYEDEIPVVHMTQQNGYSSAEEQRTVDVGLNRYGTEYREPRDQTLLIKNTVEQGEVVTNREPANVSIKKEADTIYISFDKSNLLNKSGSTLQVDSSRKEYAGEDRIIQASDKSIIVERPVYVNVDTPAPPQQPMVIEVPKYYPRQVPVAPAQPPPQVIYQRPLPPRPPPPVAYRTPVPLPPPKPIVIRAGMEPGPQRMYAKHIAPHYQRRFLSPQPVGVRQTYVRSRSASPGYASSEVHMRRANYQPNVTGHASDPGIIDYQPHGAFSHYVQPQHYGTSGGMHLNERAFSRRMNTDQRISGFTAPYNHPSAYEMQDALGLEQVTYKSNPKYSSSSGSTIERDHRFSKRRSKRM